MFTHRAAGWLCVWLWTDDQHVCSGICWLWTLRNVCRLSALLLSRVDPKFGLSAQRVTHMSRRELPPCVRPPDPSRAAALRVFITTCDRREFCFTRPIWSSSWFCSSESVGFAKRNAGSGCRYDAAAPLLCICSFLSHSAAFVSLHSHPSFRRKEWKQQEGRRGQGNTVVYSSATGNKHLNRKCLFKLNSYSCVVIYHVCLSIKHMVRNQMLHVFTLDMNYD